MFDINIRNMYRIRNMYTKYRFCLGCQAAKIERIKSRTLIGYS